MTIRRGALWLAGSIVFLLVLAIVGGVIVVRSNWFREQVRERIVATIETATGGRAELSGYRFDWKQLRAEVDRLVLHGTEPAGKPPLFRADSVAAGLKIVSLFRRDIDIQSLDVKNPAIYLIVYPDGRTNIPEPKVKARGEHSALETLVNLAIARFSLQNGVFEIEDRGKTPFDLQGRNLNAKFDYEFAGSRYRGNLSIQPLDLRWGNRGPVPFTVTMGVALERNRIDLVSSRWVTGNSSIELTGALDDLVFPHGTFRYQANASVPDVSRIFGLRGLDRGAVQVSGAAQWPFTATGVLHASAVDFHQDDIRLRGFRADAAVRVNTKEAELSGLRLSGEALYQASAFPVEGQITAVSVRNNDIGLRDISLALLGGSFRGESVIQSLARFRVRGEISGIQARRAVAIYNSRQQLPWDSLLSGAVTIDGSLRRNGGVQVSTNVTLAPVPGSPAVRGQVVARYDTLTGAVELAPSTLTLPNTRAEVSGAIGQQMRVHLETRDLNDILPVLGESSGSVPLRLENGALLFDGAVTGKPDDPQIAGKVNLTRFRYSGESIDSFQADVNASRQLLRLSNASAGRGMMRAQFQAVLGLRDWKAEESSPIAASGSLRNAAIPDLVAAFHQKALPVTGVLNLTGELAGTVGNPQASGDIEVRQGAYQEEPFDRLGARVNYTGRTLSASGGQLTAGSKQVRFEGSFVHDANRFDSGRLRVKVETNSMRLDQIQTLERVRPGIKGSVQIAAEGAADLAGANYRISDLHAEVTARNLESGGQPLGDAHLTASSSGSVLRAEFDSDFVHSMLHGQGEWRLEGDYPGTATVSFSKLDLAQLRDWVAPAKSGAAPAFAGSIEGQVKVDGPLLKPQLLKAELQIPSLELGRRAGDQFALRNSGPILASVSNSVLTVESAHFVGRATDLNIGGRVLFQQRNPLDLRVNGRIDFAVLHDFDADIASSGTMNVEAGVRGSPNAPDINGRAELQNASINYAEFPNGITNATGVVLFTGDRATIDSLTGETGGGKIKLTGFAGYGPGPLVFRLQAAAKGVRVRYPEGVSTVADADLNLTGTSERSMLAGSVTILRSGLNLQSDFSSLLAKSAEPVRTPASRTGLLGGMNFDVEIQTSPDTQFESSLTQGVQASANLRLRGTPSNPALLGRVSITEGEIVFFGTKYVISQGSVSFYNPVKIEPVLDIDLETKARGIQITLTVAGPLDKLNVTPRSDPPLEFNEIVALLVTGRSPTSDPTLMVQQNAAPQPFGQSAATALLGQVIATPVAGRLQRFFGISKLRIDPTLPGIQYNPQARLTLEQQVNPDLTFTYITNVTSANPQVVSVEWSVSKQWSLVAQREENGLFGLDVFYKRRFK